EIAALGFTADILVGGRRAMGFGECVPTGHQSHPLLVAPTHAPEGLANIPRRGDGVGVGIRPFRIHVDETHLHRAERIRQLPIAAVALVTEPRGFGSPVDLLGLPPILASTGKTERLESPRP